MKIIQSQLKETAASYDPDFKTAQQGTKNAIHDNKGAWIEPSKWTEKDLREHLAVVIDASPEYVDAYVKELFKHGLKKN